MCMQNRNKDIEDKLIVIQMGEVRGRDKSGLWD